jgi:pSer/pThr/pTyr-binding forkhead associated (FHA) protein
VHVDELGRVAIDAKWTDDDTFLAARPGPSLLLIGRTKANVKSAVVVPVGGTPGLTTLGRHPENDIVVPWGSISRRHAVIVSDDDQALLIDRGSANGTFVGKERLLPDVARALREGDEIVFGDDIHALFLTSRGLLATIRRMNSAA